MKTTLGRHCPNEEVPIRFKGAIEAHLTQALQAMRPGDPGADRQFTALGDLLLLIGDRGLARTDPRTYALWYAACAIGDPDKFELTPTMRDLIARLGTRAEPVPPADVTLTELAVAALVDAVEAVQAKVSHSLSQQAAAEEQARLKAAEATKSEERLKELNEARDVVAGLTAELDEAHASIEFLRQRSGAEEIEAAPEPKPKKPSKPRRKSIPGRTGLYVTDSGALQIGYVDSEKNQRWKTLGNPEVPAEIEAAEDLRASLSGQPFDPSMADDAREAVTV